MLTSQFQTTAYVPCVSLVAFPMQQCQYFSCSRRFAAITIKVRHVLVARLLVLFLDLCVLVPALYNFLIVAITDDSTGLMQSKVFFYFAYAFFPAVLVKPSPNKLCMS